MYSEYIKFDVIFLWLCVCGYSGVFVIEKNMFVGGGGVFGVGMVGVFFDFV